jgi:type I restriction enzyme S subunit
VTVRLKVAADLMTSCVSSEVRPFVALEHLESGTGRLVADAEVPERTAPDTGAASVEPGDVLFGKLRPYLAKTWLADRPVFASTELLCLRPRAGVDSRWLAYLVASNPVVEWAVATSDGTKMPRTSWEKLAEYRMQIPPIDDQRAIADYLDRETARIDALIDKKQRMLELLEARWLSELCFRLLSADTHSQSLYWIPRALEGWTLIPLKRLLARVWAGDWGAEPGTEDIDLPCVRASDFDFPMLEATNGVDRSFTISSATVRCLLRGDLIIEKSGGGDGVPVGRVVAWRGSEPAMPTNFAGAMRPAPMFDPEFVLLVFRAAYEIGLPWRSIKQTTGLQNLDMGHYLAHRWPVPPIEQQRFAASQLLESLQEIRLTQRKLQKQIYLLQEHRQALITAAVTGELEIPGVAA